MYVILCATIFCLGAALPAVPFSSETEKIAADSATKLEFERNVEDEVVNIDQAELERLRNIAKKIHALPNPDTVERINMENEENKDLFQGDIMLTDDQLDSLVHSEGADSTGKRRKRAALNLQKWDKVYYYIDETYMAVDSKKAAQYAVEFWQNNTCIDFEYSQTASDRIRVFSGNGCFSALGRRGGEQVLSLGPRCGIPGTGVHEFAHALGFMHTQCRKDRDNYVIVDLEQINPDDEHNFVKLTEEKNNNYGIPYDFGSVMHYGGHDFSITGNPVILAKNPEYQQVMGSEIVSFYDIEMMNEHYNCKARCPSTSTCKNGGFPHPRDCSKCLCPRGWGGVNCDQRPPGCGSEHTATESPQNVTVIAGLGLRYSVPEFHECHYLIKAPVGKKIEITVAKMGGVQGGCYSGCPLYGLEIKAANDQKMTGTRYCCDGANVGSVIVSSSNEIPIVAYNRIWMSEFTLTYRVVSGCMKSTV